MERPALAGDGPGRLNSLTCPVVSCISNRLWKHLLAAFVELLLAAGLLAGIYYQPVLIAHGGRSLGRLFSFAPSGLITWYSGLLLLLAAQSAFFIRWARSRSLKDFAGSFRIWGWTGGFWLALSLCQSTGVHRALCELYFSLTKSRPQADPSLYWLVPALVVGSCLWFRLQKEMRTCRGSYIALLIGGLLYLGAAAAHLLRLSLQQQVGPLISEVIQHSLLLAGHIALLLSMTLHARHVLYVSVAPPERQDPGRSLFSLILTFTGLRWLAARLTAWRSKAKESSTSARRRRSRATAEESEAGSSRRKRPTKKKPTRRKSSKAAEDEESADADTSELAEESLSEEGVNEESSSYEEEEAEAEEVVTETVSAAETAAAEDESETQDEWNQYDEADESSPSSGQQYRVDAAEDLPPPSHSTKAPLDKHALKGLSKRERRRLQQQMREEERAGRRGR